MKRRNNEENRDNKVFINHANNVSMSRDICTLTKLWTKKLSKIHKTLQNKSQNKNKTEGNNIHNNKKGNFTFKFISFDLIFYQYFIDAYKVPNKSFFKVLLHCFDDCKDFSVLPLHTLLSFISWNI